MATRRPDDLPYLVEQWDDGDHYVEELIALTGDYRVRGQRSQKRRSTGQAGSSHYGRKRGCSRIAAASISPLKALYRE